MDKPNMLKERKQLYEDVFAFRKPKRLPILSNLYSWMILDSGHTLTEAMHDYQLMLDIDRSCQEKYQFDAYMEVGARNCPRVTEALGAGLHIIGEDSVQILDHSVMSENDYPELAKGFLPFVFSHGFKNYAPNLTNGQFYDGMVEFMDLFGFMEESSAMLRDEMQVLSFGNTLEAPIEYLYYVLRGIKGLSIDLRRRPEQVLAAMETIWNEYEQWNLEPMLTADTSGRWSDFGMVMTAQNIMNNKQFEKFYWPHMKRFLDTCVEHNKTMFAFIEGEILPKADFLQDYEKGMLMLQLEMDDPREVRRRLPNVAISGGVSTDMLTRMAPDEAVSAVRELIDDLGEGYAVSQTKMLTFREDCKSENLKAINDFVLHYEL